MKRLIKTIDLKFFEDNGTGNWGLTHDDTIDRDNGFNAFWDGLGIFHDIFEHNHEHAKYFRGNYAMNVGGEMTAMGAMWYYYDELGMYERLGTSVYHSPGERMKGTTLSLVTESISRGYCNFGYTLESNVPYQKPIDNGELEYQISDFWKQAKDTPINAYTGDEMADAIKYKESISFRKIADLHRYGFRMAERFIPNNNANRHILTDFIEYWNNLCKVQDAEEMGRMFRGITFKIYKDNGIISWSATFNSMDYYEINDVTVNQKIRFCMDDAVKYQEEE